MIQNIVWQNFSVNLLFFITFTPFKNEYKKEFSFLIFHRMFF
jgi:hypothetical protein